MCNVLHWTRCWWQQRGESERERVNNNIQYYQSSVSLEHITNSRTYWRSLINWGKREGSAGYVFIIILYHHSCNVIWFIMNRNDSSLLPARLKLFYIVSVEIRVLRSECWGGSVQDQEEAAAAIMSLSPAVLGEAGAGTAVKRPLDTDHESGVRSGEHKKHKQDLASLPTRQYLDQTVVPILLQVCNI